MYVFKLNFKRVNLWSHIYLDYAFHRNFNVGFSSHKNDIHIQLSQWQYWWWFWFAAIWALYFFVILRSYNNKTESFNLTCNTSMRSHGKWGDFLVATIPLSWCGNILINSNFILRMIEWQNESSLFVIRIQGKQWYWAYKYSSDTNTRINNEHDFFHTRFGVKWTRVHGIVTQVTAWPIKTAAKL